MSKSYKTQRGAEEAGERMRAKAKEASQQKVFTEHYHVHVFPQPDPRFEARPRGRNP